MCLDGVIVGSTSRVLKVCLIGADSTGKTTLAENLARHYGTVWVPECARDFIESRGGQFSFDDMIKIVECQLTAEAQGTREAKRLIFCDGSALANCVWSDRYFGRRHPRVVELANTSQYDLFLYSRVDVPCETDPLRNSLEWREWLDRGFQKELQHRNCNYVSIEGSWQERFQMAVRCVDELIQRF
jgi:NadR type nicotinamide-nucleotide adenylyltransferase